MTICLCLPLCQRFRHNFIFPTLYNISSQPSLSIPRKSSSSTFNLHLSTFSQSRSFSSSSLNLHNKSRPTYNCLMEYNLNSNTDISKFLDRLNSLDVIYTPNNIFKILKIQPVI